MSEISIKHCPGLGGAGDVFIEYLTVLFVIGFFKMLMHCVN